MRVDWKQAGKGIIFALIGRLAAEVLINRYRAHQPPQDRICPHIAKGKPLKLRVVINGDWHKFCAACTDAYSSIFEMTNKQDKIVVVGIKNIGGLYERQPQKAEQHAT